MLIFFFLTVELDMHVAILLDIVEGNVSVGAFADACVGGRNFRTISFVAGLITRLFL